MLLLMLLSIISSISANLTLSGALAEYAMETSVCVLNLAVFPYPDDKRGLTPGEFITYSGSNGLQDGGMTRVFCTELLHCRNVRCTGFGMHIDPFHLFLSNMQNQLACLGFHRRLLGEYQPVDLCVRGECSSNRALVRGSVNVRLCIPVRICASVHTCVVVNVFAV